MAGPAHQVGHTEAALPHIMLATAKRTHRLQPGLLGDVLNQGEILRLVHPAVVAAEKNQRVLGKALLVQRLKHAAHADVQIANEIAKRATLALASRLFGRRDRIVHGHGREIDEERLLRALLPNP